MHNRIIGFGLCVAFAVPPTMAMAWWDGGHMQIAAVAYDLLPADIQARADTLLRLNPDYQKWTAGAPDSATASKWAFVHAATWPDDIKAEGSDYRRDAVTDPGAGEVNGYSHRVQHDYWHYKDLAFSPDDTPLPPQNPVDAVTQLPKLMAGLRSNSGATEALRSYELVWVLHLVGDLHQPLHSVARYTRELPAGDQGGNAEWVIPATGETIKLHAYWDSLLGGYTSPPGAISEAAGQDGIKRIKPSSQLAAIADPAVWTQESAALARKYAYASPVSAGVNATMLTRDYETNARNIARSQASLAAARLAELLKTALK